MNREADSSFIKRVSLRNYRSVAACDVELGPLTFLVGPNGSGKSNFLDSIRFIGDSIRTSLDHALRDRGGINEVRRRSGGHPTNFGIRIEFVLPGGVGGRFAFDIGAARDGGFSIKKEECVVGAARYKIENGVVQNMTTSVVPPVSHDRLYLVTAAGLPEFRATYDALSTMGFYNLNPDQIRALQAPQVEPDGGVLVLLDADMEGHECPATEAPRLLLRARQCAPGTRVEVVMAKWEYEAWFLAAATSIGGKRTLPNDLHGPDDPEAIRDAKGWLASRMTHGYSETVDQPALSALVDLDIAQLRSSSFDKLVRSVAALLDGPRHSSPDPTRDRL